MTIPAMWELIDDLRTALNAAAVLITPGVLTGTALAPCECEPGEGLSPCLPCGALLAVKLTDNTKENDSE